jgi:hypothetical protein
MREGNFSADLASFRYSSILQIESFNSHKGEIQCTFINNFYKYLIGKYYFTIQLALDYAIMVVNRP